MNRIELNHVTKKIKNNIILDDVNLYFESGKIYGLVGQNGSGKTMLIRSIAGLMKPTHGEILYNDKVLYKDIDLIPKLGIVIENIGLYPEFTGYKNLKLLADINKYASDADIKKSLKLVGLDPEDKRTVKKYSLGMKQKLVLAQSFMENPDVILLDEPTNALDEQAITLVRDIFKEHAKRGAIVVIASHNKEDISELCDKKFYIDSGICKEISEG